MHIWGTSRIRHRSARRLGLAATGLALVAGALPVVGGVVTGTTGVALADDIMASQNIARTGWDNTETSAQMGPSVVQGSSWEQRFNVTVNGDVYAQPLVIGSTVIVATENDWVYGLDAGTGAVKWSKSLGTPFPISTNSTFTKCTDLEPNIGITGAPAYDSTTGDIYFFANIMTSGNPEYYMVQMDLSGNVLSETPITGQPSNDTHITFSAKYNMERPGVLIDGGAVYGAFASHCDYKPYAGFVARVDISTKQKSLWSDAAGTTYNQAGIWQSGGGLMSDGPGRIFVTSGNGVSPAKGPGNKPPGELAESTIRLAYNSSTNTMSAQDFFSPAAAPTWDAADEDFGSGGPVEVPFTVGGWNTLAQIGKSGTVFLLNRNDLGGREQASGGKDLDLFASKAYQGVWGHPAIFGDTTATQTNAGTKAIDNDYVFSVGKDDVMRVFRFGVTTSNKPWLTNLANSSLTYGYTSGSPVVTSQGDDPTTAVIWEVYTPNTATKTGAGSMLEAYALGNVASVNGVQSPCNSSKPCTLDNIWHSATFTSAKFSIPATSGGWVYVGTRDGHLIAWSASGTPPPAAALTTTLPQTAVGSTSSQAVTVTATKTVTITGATASTGANNTQTTTANEFTAGQATVNGSSTPVTFPVTLHKGDKLSVITKFTPAAAGGSSGTLSLATDSTTNPTVDVQLIGEGTQQGIYAQPSTQTFVWAPDWPTQIDVPVGGVKNENVTISNLGTTTQTITSVTPPSAPFSASNLPTVGTKLIPGEAISVQLAYTPTSAGPATGSFTIVGSSGQKAVVTLQAIATPAVSQLTAVGATASVSTIHAAGVATSTLAFGSVSVGTKATEYIHVTNAGNTATTVTGVAKLSAPFAAPLKPVAGQPFNPDGDFLLPVTFTPTTKGTFTTHYVLHWRDVTGRHTLTVTITGTGV